jgi:leucyl-tRNA synthetase
MLGTKMPWDEQFLIESLSDSTIYMAYYTVAHLLQGSLDGRTQGPAGIAPEQCTLAFWDCVLLGTPYDGSVLGVPEKTVAKLRREFDFWYPMDCRVSGKDLIPNHLTMSLYNHAAIWEDTAMWPRSVFCNGFVQVDAEKMSKSKGNFITLVDAMATWGADATRFACADAGDGIVNANFDRVVADKAILNLTTELEWISSTLAGKGKDTKLRAAGAPKEWLDDWFANEMNRLVKMAEEAYAQMRFREALKGSWYEMQNARNRYRTGIEQAGADVALLRQWSEWQALA